MIYRIAVPCFGVTEPYARATDWNYPGAPEDCEVGEGSKEQAIDEFDAAIPEMLAIGLGPTFALIRDDTEIILIWVAPSEEVRI